MCSGINKLKTIPLEEFIMGSFKELSEIRLVSDVQVFIYTALMWYTNWLLPAQNPAASVLWLLGPHKCGGPLGALQQLRFPLHL